MVEIMTNIKIQDICKTFQSGKNKTLVLNQVCLEVKKSELFFLLGPSGCGKTTLLRIIAGLTDADKGSIFFDDKDITTLEPQKRNTAMVFQNYALFPHLSVLKNVEFGLKNKGVQKDIRRHKVMDKLSLVKMQDYCHRKPNQLSGGQQQRVALARALAAEPNCVLFDEPLSNLDAQLRLQMRSQIRSLIKSTSATGIYVTHDQKEALSMADRIAVMKDGVIEQIGTADEIYHKPKNSWVAEFIGEANFIKSEIVDITDKIKLDCDGFILEAVKGGNFSIGQVVNCCIRPEWIRFKQGDGGNNISAKCIQNDFFGDTRQYVFEIKDGRYLKMTAVSNLAINTQVGQQYTINIPPENICILDQ